MAVSSHWRTNPLLKAVFSMIAAIILLNLTLWLFETPILRLIGKSEYPTNWVESTRFAKKFEQMNFSFPWNFPNPANLPPIESFQVEPKSFGQTLKSYPYPPDLDLIVTKRIVPDLQLFYSYRFRTDHLGRRRSSENPGRKDATVVLLGDSLTLGVGLQEEETYASVLSRRNPAYRFVNFGIAEAGANDLYEIFMVEKKREALSDLTGPTTLVLSVPEAFWIRSVCFSRLSHVDSLWIQGKSYFTQEGENFVRKGTLMDQCRPYLWLPLLFPSLHSTNWSFGENLFRGLHKTIALIKRTHELIRIQAPQSRLVVSLMPTYTNSVNLKIPELLKKEGIEVWDFSRIHLQTIVGDHPAFVPIDNTWSPKSHSAYAILLESKIKDLLAK